MLSGLVKSLWYFNSSICILCRSIEIWWAERWSRNIQVLVISPLKYFLILKTNANLYMEKQTGDRTLYSEFLENHLKLVYFLECNHVAMVVVSLIINFFSQNGPTLKISLNIKWIFPLHPNVGLSVYVERRRGKLYYQNILYWVILNYCHIWLLHQYWPQYKYSTLLSNWVNSATCLVPDKSLKWNFL